MESLLNISSSLLATPSRLSPAGRIWLTEPAATFADHHDPIYMFIFWVSVIFFVPMMGATMYFVWKYRRRPGVPQERSAAHNTPLELSWSILPGLLLVIMFVWGFRGYLYMHTAPIDSEEIQLRGWQWNWEATYDNGARSTDIEHIAAKDVPVFVVPANRPVRFVMASRDVIHAFFVPDFRVKLDVIPNRYTTVWFEATRVNTDHYMFCAEYCGDGHSQMAAIIRVVPDAEYQEWKAAMADLFEGRTPVEVGQLLYTMQGCNACHSVDGSPGVGPTWRDVYGRENYEVLVNGQVQRITVDHNYLRESILVPGAKITRGYANEMPPYQGLLSDEEIDALIAYIKSLSERGRAELEAEAEDEAENDNNAEEA